MPNNAPKPTPATFYEFGSSIYELVGEDGDNLFLKYDAISELVELCDEIMDRGRKIIPLEDHISRNGIVLLPTKAEEYGSIEDLEQEIRRYIHRYVQLTEFGDVISTQYVLLSWIYDNFETIPYMRFHGDYGSGKSRAERVIGSICYKPIFAGGSTTPSPIFRIIELYRGTLVIDEADFPRSDAAAEITKILNCGYSRGTPVLRSEANTKGKFKIKAYNVFSPKILATREKFSDIALESRCITERMRPRTRRDIPLHLPDEFGREALRLRNKLLMFRFRNYHQLVYDQRFEIPGVEPRVNQVMVPILALARDEQRENLINFIKSYNHSIIDQRADSVPAQILQAIVELKDVGDLPYKTIAKHINSKRDIEQGEKPIQPVTIGKVNKNDFGFEVSRPKNVAHIVWDQKLGQDLCQRYGVELSEEETDGFGKENESGELNGEVSNVSNVSFAEAQGIFLGAEPNSSPVDPKKPNIPNIVNPTTAGSANEMSEEENQSLFAKEEPA